MYLGIDIGTSSVKAVLIDAEQAVVADASADLTVSRPQPGWSEQDPEAWWRATQTVLDQLAAEHPGEVAAVAGIGLSGQMHGATLLDAEDKPLRPAILWNDGRSAAQCTAFEAACPRARVLAGNIAMPGFTAPKLLWLREHEPDVFARTAKVLLPKDYVRLCLTGDHVSEMSDAAGTLWLDVGARRWSDELLAATGLSRAQMPALVEGSEISGQLRADLVARWGLARRPVVAGGGGDNAASACGLGCVEPGAAFLSLGTSGVLFVSTARFAPNTAGAVHAFCHALPATWHQMGVILSATDSLNWLARLFDRRPADLVAAVERAQLSPASVIFLPYLSGERTPHNDAGARGLFAGLSHDVDRAELTRGVLDGVAFAFRDCLEALAAAGTEVERLTAVGGGARSRIWLRILATVLGLPIDVVDGSENGAAFGAARLALAAAEAADPRVVCQPLRRQDTIEPEAGSAPAYAAAFARYRALYPATREALSR